jgi:hypothetical protein
MQRASAFHHLDGEDATISMVTSGLAGHEKLIIEWNTNIYSTEDMKVGIDLPAMQRCIKLLKDIVKLDPRGGIFLQNHMSKALGNVLSEGDYKALLLGKTIDQQKPLDEIIDLIAYKIRVMLAHLRLSFDSSQNDKNHPLKDVFACMQTATSSCSSNARKARRQERLGKRPHPFMCFRPADDQDEDMDEPVTIVTKYFDGNQRVAKMLMSDGSTINADKYTAGSDGCLVASWFKPAAQLSLTVPNSNLHGDQIVKYQPPICKRPAKADKKEEEELKEEDEPIEAEDTAMKSEEEEGGAEEEEEEEEEKPDEKKPASKVELKIRPGHDNSMTIVVLTDSKDKAQVLEVNGAHGKQAKMTPRELCESIIQCLYEDLKDCEPPVSGAEWLPQVRQTAREYRGAFLC